MTGGMMMRDDSSSSTNVFKDAAMLGATKSATQIMSFTEQEILEILLKMRTQSSNGEQQVLNRVLTLAQNGAIGQEQFVVILMKDGNLSQYDASKVANFFGVRGQVNIIKFQDYLKSALQMQTVKSATL